MSKPETAIKRVYQTIAAYTSSEDLLELAKMVANHERAARQLGISAQCAAIDDLNYTCRQMAKEMPDYYQGRFVESITNDIEGL